jgi:hypothetical protein
VTSQPGRAARWYASGEMTVRKGSSGPDAGLGKFETVAFPSRGRFERLIIRKEPERADPGVGSALILRCWRMLTFKPIQRALESDYFLPSPPLA